MADTDEAKHILIRDINNILEFISSADEAIDNIKSNTDEVKGELVGLVQMARAIDFDDGDQQDIEQNLGDAINRFNGVCERLKDAEVEDGTLDDLAPSGES